MFLVAKKMCCDCSALSTDCRIDIARQAGILLGARRPKWRNWQTRYVQGVVLFGECGFDSHLRHSTELDHLVEFCVYSRATYFPNRRKIQSKLFVLYYYGG